MSRFLRAWLGTGHMPFYADLSSRQVVEFLKLIAYEGGKRWPRIMLVGPMAAAVSRGVAGTQRTPTPGCAEPATKACTTTSSVV